MTGFCEHSNEHSGSVKGGEFLRSLLIYFYAIKSSHEEQFNGLTLRKEGFCLVGVMFQKSGRARLSTKASFDSWSKM